MLKQISIAGSPLRLSAMALGAWGFHGQMAPAATDRLYELYRQAGGNCFDTAHCYSFWLPGGAGSAERALGSCIRRHGDSRGVYVITKGGHPAVEPHYPRPERYLAPEVLSSDIAQSLERLGMEAIDLYLLHRDDPRVPVGEIIDALNDHIAAGRLRAIGVSNWAVARIAAANDYAHGHGRHAFVVSQPQFSLGCPNAPVPTRDPAMRYLTDSDIAWHTQTGLPALCYSPTAGGYFASDGLRRRKGYENAVSRQRLVRATELAKELGVTPHQIALAYLLCQPFPAIPILGSGDPDHLAESFLAAEIVLSAEQVRWLREGDRGN